MVKKFDIPPSPFDDFQTMNSKQHVARLTAPKNHNKFKYRKNVDN